MSALRLYSYFRSGAAYRTRIALNLKGLSYETVPVHLLRNGGEHLSEAFRALNPQARIPALEADGAVLTQSPAILEWLEETYPTPTLLPGDALMRARIRAVAAIICCDAHPLGNVSVQNWLKRELSAPPEKMQAWLTHWMHEGFAAIERLVAPGPFAFGDAPTLADVCLVPQVFAARRFNVPLECFPRIVAAAAACEALPAFQAAAPSAQPDAE